MEYTKRDLELVQILRDNFEVYLNDNCMGSSGLCDCVYDLMDYDLITGSDFTDLKRLLRKELWKIKTPKDFNGYFWPEKAIEPRKQFLDDLIKKIKNSLSS